MRTIINRFVADERGVVMGLSLWGYTLILVGLFVIVVGGLFFADAQVRIHATQAAEQTIQQVQYMQSEFSVLRRREKENFSLVASGRAVADVKLAERHLPALDEKIIRFDLERVTPQVLRLTMVTQATFETGLMRLFGIGAVTFRAMSAQETSVDCVPVELPPATGPKGPAIVVRNTGLLDKILRRGVGEPGNGSSFKSRAVLLKGGPSGDMKGCVPNPDATVAKPSTTPGVRVVLSSRPRANAVDVPFQPDVPIDARPSESRRRWSISSP